MEASTSENILKKTCRFLKLPKIEMVSFKKKITVLETELVCLLELIFKGKFVLEVLKNYP